MAYADTGDKGVTVVKKSIRERQVMYTRIPDIDMLAAGKLRKTSVATLYEAAGKSGLMEDGIRRCSGIGTICGPAVTCLTTLGDNLSMHAAVHVAVPGSVVVIACDTAGSYGMWGEVITQKALSKGVSGVVADGGVRDSAGLKAAQFSVWARTVNARGAEKKNFGGVNIPVVCGGVLVSPGDFIVADDDGIVVIAPCDVGDILAKAEARVQHEDELVGALKRGEAVDVLDNLEGRLADLGVRVEDATWLE